MASHRHLQRRLFFSGRSRHTIFIGDWSSDVCSSDLGAARGLMADEVIALHSGAEYFVSAIGFLPGFPYLRGLPERLHTPRGKTPRTRVPAGSVAIGGPQTGISPFETPGGWNLIGCTPWRLFNAYSPAPSLLQVGDRVHFKPITPQEYG